MTRSTRDLSTRAEFLVNLMPLLCVEKARNVANVWPPPENNEKAISFNSTERALNGDLVLLG